MMTYLFLDTNIYLHFKQFDQIKWKELLNIEDFTIVVPLAVISELDDNKTDRVERISKQAKQILKLLEKYNDNKFSTDKINIILQYIDSNTDIFIKNSLNSTKGDDKILASILEFKEKHSENIILIAFDTAIRLRANQYNIKTYEPPDNLLIKIEDTTEKKIKELERENTLLKNKIPDLKIYFDNNEVYKEFKLVKNEFVNCDLEKSMKEIKNKVPHTSLDNEIQKSDNIFNAFLKTTFVNQEIVNRHNLQVDEYYKNYEKYLNDMIKYSDILCKSIKVNLILENSGIVPAKDIHIDFHIPDGVDVMKERDFPREPIIPDIPYLYSYFDITKNCLHNYPLHNFHIPNAQNLPAPNVSNFTIKKTNSYNMSMKVVKLMHQTKTEIKPFYIVFEKAEETYSFSFTYNIIAENIPKRIKGNLNIKIVK